MRPKKLVLVLDPNDESLSVAMFTLLIRGYKSVGAHTLAEAHDILAKFAVDATLIMNNHQEAVDMSMKAGVPFVVKAGHGMEDVLAILKIRSMRPRGPRPGFKKPISSLMLS